MKRDLFREDQHRTCITGTGSDTSQDITSLYAMKIYVALIYAVPGNYIILWLCTRDPII